ncbi:hypothetical protein P7C71_g5509, partial [Lecanoromycetidae sp. Uapishka_2]
MSLTVKHLNGDTTFLLTFAPTDNAPPSPPGFQYQQPPGTFSILIDPWITGPSTMWHPKFLLSKHTTEPAAAKKIRGFKFFNPDMVHSLREYEKKPDSVIRFGIHPIVPGGTPGEVTISFIPAKMDMAGVHNAIGITYRPPSTTSLPLRPFSPISPNSKSRFYQISQKPPAPVDLPLTPPDSPTRQTSALSYTSHPLSHTSSPPSQQSSTFSNHNRSISSVSSVTSTSRVHTERALSVIYSPHGVNYSLIEKYASKHLMDIAALPLTLLLHSFDRVNNPWWMGGNIAAGLPGGVEIAQKLMAKCWISAHDEDKDNSGLSVMSTKTRKHNIDEVREMLRRERRGNVDVANLGVGAEMVLRA